MSARVSISVSVRSLGRPWGGRDDRLVAELSHYMTPAEVLDIEAALDRYPDEDTAEMREILAGRAGSAAMISPSSTSARSMHP